MPECKAKRRGRGERDLIDELVKDFCKTLDYEEKSGILFFKNRSKKKSDFTKVVETKL